MEANKNRGFTAQKPAGKFANWNTGATTANRAEAVAEIERESNVRMKCYDRWIAEGKMTDDEASKRMNALVAAWHMAVDTDIGRKLSLEALPD